jgi:tetratricopeptide (TPR) repeat protein
MSYYADAYNSGLTYSTEAQEFKDSGDDASARESFQKALQEFKKAVIYRENEPEAWMSIGKSHFNLGNIDSALVNFDHAHSIAPDDPKVNATLYEVYKAQGNQAFGAGIEAKQAGDDAKAKEYFEAALSFYTSAGELGEEDIDIAQNRAGIEWELSDLDPVRADELRAAAATDYQKVLAAEPDNGAVLENLSMLESSRGNKDKALEYATRLVDLDPKDAAAHILQGRAQGALDNRSAMLGDLLIGQSLDSGTQVPSSQARAEAEKFGSRSDMLAQLRESGEPEEIRSYSDTGGSEYQIWFYWTRGRAYCFQGGKEIYAKQFKGVTEDTGSDTSGE